MKQPSGETLPEPFVSAIVAVYNGEQFLAEALESMLAQSRPPDEILVVDDGSTDGTADVAQHFSVQYIFQENAGQSVALNKGIEQSSGDFLAFLDADDLWIPDRIERQLAVFEAEPDVQLVYGHAEQFFDESHPSAKVGHSPLHPIMPAHLPSALLAQRSAVEAIGPFRGRTGQTVDWYARALELDLPIKTLDEVMFRRRIHADNIGIRERDLRDGYLDVIRAALARRSA